MKVHHAQVSARYRSITEWLSAEGRVDVVEAAARLGVAQETIRRDLRALELDGKLQRVHGGAVPVEDTAISPVPVLDQVHDDDVRMSERVWAGLPRTGTILLGTGRLTLALAHAIVSSPPEHPGLTMVTNSLDAAIVLSRASKLSVYNVGGTVSPVTRAQEGDWALHELARFSVDVSDVCPPGSNVDRGLSESTPGAAAVAQAAVTAARCVLVLADAQTLGAAAFVQFATLDQVDQIAVAGPVSVATLQPFYDRGVSVALSPPDSVAGEGVRTLEETSS
ncbi:MAG: DeoR/GlpR family DNA-binding transcription regulator [Propionibacteriaceae bacterium]